MRACVKQQSGLDIILQGETNEVIQEAIPGGAGDAYNVCYTREFYLVDGAWQAYRANFGADANALAECLRERGATPELTYMGRYNQLSALGVDPLGDCIWKKIPNRAPRQP